LIPISTWEGKWLVDPTTRETEAYIKALLTQLRGWGYDYFKIDGQPIVVDEYNAKQQFMSNKPSESGAELYRRTLGWIRDVIGLNRYLLGCWGIPTEGAGIMNGSRTGDDIVLCWGGFKIALSAVMSYYYQHNVMWYVDPDVMVLRSPLTPEQARVWATLQGLTGQALMATDRMMDLGEERVEVLRRVYPAVDIRPLDLFPAQRDKRIWDLKVHHLGRTYDVVGIFNFSETNSEQIHLKWDDLGLPSDKPLHVFDFWNKEYLGAWEAGMTLDISPTSCRVLTVLPSNGQIQLISTNRHITQGWVDLAELEYNNATKTYSGKSHIIKKDPYELRFVFPRDHNFAIKNATAKSGAKALQATVTNHQGWAVLKIQSGRTADVTWEARFKPAEIYSYPVGEAADLHVERPRLDGVNLTWSEQYYLNVGYQVYLDGKLQGYTPKAAFQLRGLDPDVNHTVAVETVWENGVVSKRKAESVFSLRAMIPKQIPLIQLQPNFSGGRTFGFLGERGIIRSGPVSVGIKFYPDSIIIPPGIDAAYEIKASSTP
jgi:hypothetical protein